MVNRMEMDGWIWNYIQNMKWIKYENGVQLWND